MDDSRRTELLVHEAQLLGRYLARDEIPQGLVARYVDHLKAPDSSSTDRLDLILLRFARQGGLFIPLADAYARWLRPAGALRTRLTIMCAIVESSPPFHTTLGQARVGSSWGSACAVALTAVSGAMTLVGAALLFGPLHLGLLTRKEQRVS